MSLARPDRAWRYADTVSTATVMIVQGGRVVASRGDLAHRYQCHSVRKSFLSALIGIHEEEGRIDLSRTLADLGIDDKEGLSEREFSVFVQLARGLSVAQIAENLKLSPSTVGTHLYHIKQKLNVQNAAELALVALRNGMIDV